MLIATFALFLQARLLGSLEYGIPLIGRGLNGKKNPSLPRLEMIKRRDCWKRKRKKKGKKKKIQIVITCDLSSLNTCQSFWME
jgi:hypothetical protein